MKNTVKLLGCALLLCASAGVKAQEAGTFMFKVGFAHFDPIVGSGDLSAPSLPNTKVDVGTANTGIFTLAYMFTDHLSAEIYGGVPVKHTMYGAGAIQGVGAIGTVKQLPPTLFGQYRFFEASSAFRPYLGLGLTYAKFIDETGSAALTALTNPGGPGTTFSVQPAWGITPQAGFSAALNKQWYLDFSFNKSIIKTTTNLSTGQYVNTTLNPVVTQFSVGYRF